MIDPFTTEIIESYRVTIPWHVRKYPGLEIGDTVRVSIKLIKKAERKQETK